MFQSTFNPSTPQLGPVYEGPTCKGDWVIGTACGSCERCKDNAPKAVNHFRNLVIELEAINMNLREKLTRIGELTRI